MMKRFNYSVLILAFALLSSCKKEGCTDQQATNYDENAKKENGTCTYEGTHVFWYGEDAAEFLINDGASSLTFYVDNQIIGSSAASVYWTSAPECGQASSITVTKQLGNVKTQAYNFEVIDQTGWVYWEGTLNFNANQCISFELK